MTLTNTARIAALEKGLAAETARAKAAESALDARIAKLEGSPPVTPPVTPPTTGIPAMPGGARWSKDFADDSLAPFRSSTIPSDPNHLSVAHGGTAAADNPMAVYDRYGDNSTNPPTPLHLPDFSGSVARLVATRRQDGLYAGTIISTADDPAHGAASHTLRTGKVRFACRMNIGDVIWNTPLWLVGWTGWSWNDLEIDIGEAIKGMLTFNIHKAGQQVYGFGMVPPADLATTFHVLGADITSSTVAFNLDGKQIGPTASVAIDHDMAYLSDAKVGVPWENKGPSAATPDPAWVELAWVWEGA